MRWRVDPAKPFSREIRSLAEKLITAATQDLSRQEDGPHKAVHSARKKFKRLRALYLLVQPDARQFRKRENARFRAMARSLSVARDAAALVETVEWMSQTAKTEAEANALAFAHNVLALRRDDIVAGDTDLQGAINRAITECEAATGAVATLDLSDTPRACAKRIATVWARQQEKAHRVLGLCHTDSHVEHFHDLRKCSQIRWMHLGLLRDLWPCAMVAMHDDAKRLVETLGHEHDLSVLAAFADHEPQLFGNGETLAGLLGAIIDRQQSLRSESLELAARVFRGTPQDEARRIRLLWLLAA